jgi:DNA-binding NarL/FixJ family response regulator
MPANSPIRILVVDDHPLIREGIASVLAGETDMTLVAEASNGQKPSSSSVGIVRT